MWGQILLEPLWAQTETMNHSLPVIFQNLHKSPGAVLDIGAGKGWDSIYAASLGARVLAVDRNEIPDLFKNHPNIRYVQADLNFWEAPTEPFDVILLHNVIQFLDRNHFLNNLLPHLWQQLTDGGILSLIAFGPDDAFYQKKLLPPYRFEQLLEALPGAEVLEQKEETVDDFDAERGKHQHHLYRLMARKR